MCAGGGGLAMLLIGKFLTPAVDKPLVGGEGNRRKKEKSEALWIFPWPPAY